MLPQIVRSTNFARDAACFILDHAGPAIAKRGLFRLGLAGGNTPRLVYAQLATLGGNLLWSKVQITFGDERCVSPAHPESNYLMAKQFPRSWPCRATWFAYGKIARKRRQRSEQISRSSRRASGTTLRP
jgi:hypothetical protein